MRTAPFYRYLTMDIETYDASPEAADRWMAHCWRPDTLGTGSGKWKPDTVAKRLIEMADKKREKLALLDESPCIIIAMKSDTEFRLLHCLEVHDDRLFDGATMHGYATEAEMLIAFRMLLDDRCVLPNGKNANGEAAVDSFGQNMTPTEFVGHNIYGFDLRKLRTCFLCNDVQLPRALVEELPLFDTMTTFKKRFGLGDAPFIGLDAIKAVIGLEPHKHLIDGSQVTPLIDAKRFDVVQRYALLDVVDSENIYLRMIGRHPGLK